jgi:hypothetical protein
MLNLGRNSRTILGRDGSFLGEGDGAGFFERFAAIWRNL